MSRHGHAFIDRALYLPKGWTDDPARLKTTYVPDDVSFSTKPQLAAEMIEGAHSASIPIIGLHPGANRNGLSAPPRRSPRRSNDLTGGGLSAGAGTKGPRLHDWCYLELADLEGEESNHHSQVLWTRGLLIRRNIANGDLAYFTTWCPAGTSIKTLVSVEGHRWAIEDSFETAKNEFGARPQQIQILARLASSRLARHARLRHDGCHPTSGQQAGAQKTKSSATPRHPISPLVDPGNPPHSPTSRAKAQPTRRCHRMVALAAGSSGRSTEISCQTKITTVMLGSELINFSSLTMRS